MNPFKFLLYRLQMANEALIIVDDVSANQLNYKLFSLIFLPPKLYCIVICV
jgi:hypothetical protein